MSASRSWTQYTIGTNSAFGVNYSYLSSGVFKGYQNATLSGYTDSDVCACGTEYGTTLAASVSCQADTHLSAGLHLCVLMLA